MAQALGNLIDQLLVDKTSLIKLMKLTSAHQVSAAHKTPQVAKPLQDPSSAAEKTSENSASDDVPAISFSNLLTYQQVKDQLQTFGLDSSTLQQTQ